MDTFLDKHVAREDMPSEYGGSIGTIKEIQEGVIKRLQDSADFFKEEDKNCAEKRAIPDDSGSSSQSNAGGNFRKLEFD